MAHSQWVFQVKTQACFTARRTNATVDGQAVDLGLVGEVESVRPEAVLDVIDAGRIPVISSVAPDPSGEVHNVNADTAAAALAVALKAEKLLVLTDVEGLYRDWPNSPDLIQEISPEALKEMLPTLASGMVPKMQACYNAVANGCPQGDRRRWPRAARLACWSSSPTRGSAPRCLPGVETKLRKAREAS
jgi:acetylglutamate kinase